jgi:hypothetical protein
LKAEIKMILLSTPELLSLAETIGSDYVAKDIQSLIEWAENVYKIELK